MPTIPKQTSIIGAGVVVIAVQLATDTTTVATGISGGAKITIIAIVAIVSMPTIS